MDTHYTGKSRSSMKLLRILTSFAVVATFCACSKPAQQVVADSAPVASMIVTIMTFNVENLFDNVDDPGKDDHTYLALESKQSAEHLAKCAQIDVERWREQCLNWDWSEQVIENKLNAVASAILQINDGRGPDVIALQEVENLAILERLRTEHLQAAEYLPAILVEGHDRRGIDVAFLSRLPLAAGPVLHPFPSDGIDADRYADTRGVLEATFALPDDALLTGFAVHFPAPFHPTLMRVIAYNHLNYLQSQVPAGNYIFAAGDFNTTFDEDREQDMLGRFARPSWTVAHDYGCGDCRGTQYYAAGDSWSFLDMILWSPAVDRGGNATWQIRAESVAVANAAAGQTEEDGTPGRWQMPEARGVSDHWPLVMTIEQK